MAGKFAEITFTPSVKAAQTRYGSRAANERFEFAEDSGDTLGESKPRSSRRATVSIRRRSMKTVGPMCSFAAARPAS